MKIVKRLLNDVLLLEPTKYVDERGVFFESFNHAQFEILIGKAVNFVQDNQSISNKHVLRGLHAQRSPSAQSKLIQVMSGKIYDVIVDIRPESPTFWQWESVELCGNNPQLLWVPEGFAHGFYSLTNNTQLFYKTSAYYSPEREIVIPWNEPSIGIKWPLTAEPLLSPKDKNPNR